MSEFNFDFAFDEKKALKDAPKELSDEIRAFREKNKEFESTNEHETYLIVCFSSKSDKLEFCENAGITEHTMVDGYELARQFKIKPDKPKFKLKKPLK